MSKLKTFMTNAGTLAAAYGAASLTHHFFQGGDEITLSKLLLVFGARGVIAMVGSRFSPEKVTINEEKAIRALANKEVREVFLTGKWRVPLLHGMFVAPLVEEAIFRLPVVFYPFSNPLTAAVFGYMHKGPTTSASSALNVLQSAIAGATFGALTISYGWWAGTLLHILNNMFALGPVYLMLSRNEEKIKKYVIEHSPDSENP